MDMKILLKKFLGLKTEGREEGTAEQKRKSVLRDWIESILIAFVLAMFIRAFFVQAFKIPTGSMRMTLLEGDAILVNKLAYGPKVPLTSDLRLPGFGKPQRGDVIVFIYPIDPKKDFIKRLVAKGGETVMIRNGTIFVNDKPLTDPCFNTIYYYNWGEFAKEGEKIVVPENSYFVLGDNSASSQDSRYWGFVPSKNVVGKAMLIYWPPHRIRLIH
jgi:signal peptidase I